MRILNLLSAAFSAAASVAFNVKELEKYGFRKKEEDETVLQHSFSISLQFVFVTKSPQYNAIKIHCREAICFAAAAAAAASL